MTLVAFDLDGTLAESKQAISQAVAERLSALLASRPVAVISGGALPQFLRQVVDVLPTESRLEHLYLLPTSGAALYRYHNGEWHKVYEERISERDAETISHALTRAAKEVGIDASSASAWGPRIEYRGGQVSFSALGQHAPVSLKKEWDPEKSKRVALLRAVNHLLPPAFHAAMGGLTTIDVTRRGVDKAYGIRKLCALLSLNESDVLYVGDELVAGGNDEVIFETSAETKLVNGPAETVQVIDGLLASPA